MNFKLRIGANRNNMRIWIERKDLVDFGFKEGAKYKITYNEKKHTITIKLDKKEGNRVVSGKIVGDSFRPVIDLCSQKIAETFNYRDVGSKVGIVVSKGKIVIK